MARTYWIDLFTIETWKEFRDHGSDVSGFSEKRWKTVQRMKHGIGKVVDGFDVICVSKR
jgi:hypothetical protein